MSTIWWHYRKNQGLTKFILGNINVSTKGNGNPSLLRYFSPDQNSGLTENTIHMNNDALIHKRYVQLQVEIKIWRW